MVSHIIFRHDHEREELDSWQFELSEWNEAETYHPGASPFPPFWPPLHSVLAQPTVVVLRQTSCVKWPVSELIQSAVCSTIYTPRQTHEKSAFLKS